MNSLSDLTPEERRIALGIVHEERAKRAAGLELARTVFAGQAAAAGFPPELAAAVTDQEVLDVTGLGDNSSGAAPISGLSPEMERRLNTTPETHLAEARARFEQQLAEEERRRKEGGPV